MEEKEELERLKQVLLGRLQVRKTARQKEEFIHWARDYAEELGIPASVEESGRRLRTRNLVFGDADRARILITAHYDTCARSLLPTVTFPMSIPLFILEQVCLTAMLLAAGVIPAAAGACAGLGVPLCILLFVLGAAAGYLLLIFGPANPHTANDNTSGTALVLLAMSALRGRKDTAFVLFDNEEVGLLGSAAFLKAHRAAARRAFVLQSDCVSDGDNLLFTGSRMAMRGIYGKRMENFLREETEKCGKRAVSGTFPDVIFPSDQMLFPRGAALAALRGKKYLYLGRIHTARDTVFEDENLLCLLAAVRRLAESMDGK